MNQPKIYMIHDSARKDRRDLFRKEMETQGVDTYELVSANKETMYPVKNIARAHKECIRRALREDLLQVCICEDDVRWVCPGAYNRFLELSGKLPDGWDIFISGSYEYVREPANYEIGSARGQVISPFTHLKRFSGLHCYLVQRKAYQKILDLPETKNFDKEISGAGLNCWLAWPMLCLQQTTKSDNTGKTMNYDEIYKHRIKIWNCNLEGGNQ